MDRRSSHASDDVAHGDLSGAPLGERYQAFGTVELDRLLWHQLWELANSGQSFAVSEQIVRFALQSEGVIVRTTLDVRPA